jgi:hypothetical protein
VLVVGAALPVVAVVVLRHQRTVLHLGDLVREELVRQGVAAGAGQVLMGPLRPQHGAGLLLVYLSSTADLFLTGLGNGVQLPVALALLAVAGVLLRTLLRVRAFLLLR